MEGFKVGFLLSCLAFISSCNGQCTQDVPITDNIERPCCDLTLDCVRKWFQGRMEGCSDTSVSLGTHHLFLNYYKLVVVQNDLCIEGLDSPEITVFYINPDTDRIVLSMAFPSINITSNSLFYGYPRGKEVVTLEIPISERISNVEITMMFSNINSPSLLHSESHMWGDFVSLTFAECDLLSTDPTLKKFYTSQDIAYQESFLNRAPLFGAYVFQKHIFNQGLSNKDVLYLRGPLNEFP